MEIKSKRVAQFAAVEDRGSVTDLEDAFNKSAAKIKKDDGEERVSEGALFPQPGKLYDEDTSRLSFASTLLADTNEASAQIDTGLSLSEHDILRKRKKVADDSTAGSASLLQSPPPVLNILSGRDKMPLSNQTPEIPVKQKGTLTGKGSDRPVSERGISAPQALAVRGLDSSGFTGKAEIVKSSDSADAAAGAKSRDPAKTAVNAKSRDAADVAVYARSRDAAEAAVDAKSRDAADVAANAKSRNAAEAAVDAKSRDAADVAANAKSRNAVEAAVDAKSRNAVEAAVDAKSRNAAEAAVVAKSRDAAGAAANARSRNSAGVAVSAKSRDAAEAAVDAKSRDSFDVAANAGSRDAAAMTATADPGEDAVRDQKSNKFETDLAYGLAAQPASAAVVQQLPSDAPTASAKPEVNVRLVSTPTQNSQTEPKSAQENKLTYSFSEWGKGHRVDIQLRENNSPHRVTASDGIVQQRLADYQQEHRHKQPEWVFADAEDRHNERKPPRKDEEEA